MDFKLKKVSFVVDKVFQNNIIFDKNQIKLRVGSFDKYYALYDEFKKYGYEIATDDINTVNESVIVLYLDMPKVLPKIQDIEKSYLLAIESSIIRPENFDGDKLKYFNKVFIWNDELVDNKNFFKINYAFKLPTVVSKNVKKEKLCCLIVSNKNSKFKNELYSERKKLIRWFEENHPHDFDLYGIGWNEYNFSGIKLIRAFNKIPIAKQIMFKYFGEYYASYKGKVDNKFNIMQKYKFAIAYENVKDEPGYITEKIFDVFFAGCVPIYYGANNIMDYIPKNCFIDRRNFNSDDELYNFLKSIDNESYIEYLKKIEIFLQSSQAKQFTVEVFAKTIVKTIIKELNV